VIIIHQGRSNIDKVGSLGLQNSKTAAAAVAVLAIELDNKLSNNTFIAPSLIPFSL
jgi:hypothetical protein